VLGVTVIAAVMVQIMHRLYKELVKLNEVQQTYREMWQEDREESRRQDEENRQYWSRHLRSREHPLITAIRAGRLPAAPGQPGFEEAVRVIELLRTRCQDVSSENEKGR
jgi:hypothetical protein